MTTIVAKPITPPVVKKEFVLAKCKYFTEVQLWPILDDINPERWLTNFSETEMDHAIHLLNSFIYFSDSLTNKMFEAAFQGLSNCIRRPADSYLNLQGEWRAFINTVIVTPVTGEIPNITDSGFIFARMARQRLGIGESQIMSSKEALELLLARGPRPVVFVDDFVGSGDQFSETWERLYTLSNSITMSFDRYSSVRGSRFYYCPILCTDDGVKRLKREYPKVEFNPTHVLTSRYSALSDDSFIWPPHLKATAQDFLRQVSIRAGIPDTNGMDENDWRGFHKLGLTVAFKHSVPDATLPIFYWEQNDWKPLIRKS